MIWNLQGKGNRIKSYIVRLDSVMISGTESVGSTLTATPSVPSTVLNLVKYQWLRDGSTISGASAKTYKLVDDDRGHKISVKATLFRYTVESAKTGKIYGWKIITANLYNMTSADTPTPFEVTRGSWRFWSQGTDIDSSLGLPYGNTTYDTIIDLSSAMPLLDFRIRFLNKYNAYTREGKATINISGSSDGSSWEVFKTATLTTTNHTPTVGAFPVEQTFSISNKTYRYIRMQITTTDMTYSNAWVVNLLVTRYKEWTNGI